MRFRKRKKKNDNSDEVKLKGQSITSIDAALEAFGYGTRNYKAFCATIMPRDFSGNVRGDMVSAAPETSSSSVHMHNDVYNEGMNAQMSTALMPAAPVEMSATDEDDVSSVIHELTARMLAGEFEPNYVSDDEDDLKEDSIIDLEEKIPNIKADIDIEEAMIEAELALREREINKHKEIKPGTRKLTLG